MIIIDPQRVFEDKGGTCVVKAASMDFSAGNNNAVVSAVTGKSIRVMGWKVSGNGVATMLLKSGSGGTALTGTLVLPDGTTTGTANELTLVIPGYFQTASGVGLYADIATNNSKGILFYCEVTPP